MCQSQNRKPHWIIVISGCAIGLMMLAFAFSMCMGKSYLSNAKAMICWHRSGLPMTLLIKLTDGQGRPVQNAIVDSESYSGRSGNSTSTDLDGLVAFGAAENELIRLYVNDECVADLSDRRFFLPSIGRGLVVTIQLVHGTTRAKVKANN